MRSDWLCAGLLALALALGCAHDDAMLEREIDGLARALDQHEAALDRASARTAALARSWGDVAARFEAAERDFSAAEASFASAREAPVRDERALAEAAAQAERAATRWGYAEALIATAAALDARRLARKQPAPRGQPAGCRGAMTTAAYRTLLLARGIALHGMHIDHIVPRALGGADHPSNYQILRARDNLRLGARWNLAKCMGAGRATCVRAVEISRRCGSFSGGIPLR
ncbi:MAG: HNH endonuclease signature motif containing protein [Polyangiales bacterium]